MTDDELEQLALSLVEAERSRVAVTPLTSRVSGLTLDHAYAVQGWQTKWRLEAGESIVGRKVGLTSAAMQEQLGVSEPDFGVLFESMAIMPGSVLALDSLLSPRVEAEFAFRLGQDLPGLDADRSKARAAVSEVMVALEIIDSRVLDWKIGLVDTVADNASSARVVFGAPQPATTALLDELPARKLELQQDGVFVDGGVGAAVLGDPLEAVAWLARRLASFGEILRAGDLILAGAVHASRPLTSGAEFAAQSDGFEPVAIATI